LIFVVTDEPLAECLVHSTQNIACRNDFYSETKQISTADETLRHELFQKIYKEHSAEIFAYLQRFVMDQEVSADLLQETFIIFLQKVDLAKAETSRSFLYAISRSLALKYLKSKKRFASANFDQLSDNNKSAEDNDRNLLRDHVLQRLNLADPVYAEIYELRVESGLKLEELAEVLKMPPRTLNRRIQEMKELLYRILSEGGAR